MYVKLLLTFLYVLKNCNGNVDIFMGQKDTAQLLGLTGELYYIRNGQVNENACKYLITIPTNVIDTTITWRSISGKQISYIISINSSNSSFLIPTLNISKTGNIPISPETFTISLDCSNVALPEIHFTVSIKIIKNALLNDFQEITIYRRKQCHYSSFNDKSVNVLSAYDFKSVIHTYSTRIGCAICTLFVIILLTFIYTTRAPQKQMLFYKCSKENAQKFQVRSSNSLSQSISEKENSEPEELYRRVAELTVQRCRIQLSDLVQEGTFGRIYRGIYNDCQEVLIKTVAIQANQTQVSLLLQEGISLYGASHIGILSVLGVCLENDTTPFLLYPITGGTRNLKLFLQEPTSRSLTTIQIVKMSSQIVAALKHLHEHSVIHRDVAARNCVVDDQLRIKLADSSLSRDLFPADYTCLGDSENRPIKWLSLESLQTKTFSEASDTWAFGVLLWELCTLARQPYQEVVDDEMEQFLRDGYRLAQPLNCPDELFAMMAYCWALSPLERPTFVQLQICLQDFYNQITRYV